MDAVTGIKVFAFGIAIVLTISLNGVILMTFFVAKRPRFSTKCIHIFVTNLAVCQLLIGLLVMPFVLVSIIYDGWKESRTLCQFNGFTTSTCFYTAVLMLCAISLDRFVAIVLATKYQKLLTKKRGYIIIFLIWTMSSILSMPPLIGWSTYKYHPGTLHCSPVWIGQCGYFYFTFTISVMVPTTLTVVSYLIIFWKIRKHRKRVSMWKHASERRASSQARGAESDIEMSQVVTIHKSPAVIHKGNNSFAGSRTALQTSSPSTSHQSLSPLMNARKSKARTWSRESTEAQDQMQATSPGRNFRNRRFLEFQTEDVFYSPKNLKAPKSDVEKIGQPVTVEEYKASDQDKTALKNEVNDDGDVKTEGVTNGDIKGEKSTRIVTEREIAPSLNVQLVDPKENVKFRLRVKKKSETNYVNVAATRKSETVEERVNTKARKRSLKRLMKMSRGQKMDHFKLSEEDANGLLNISQENETKSRNFSTSESSTQDTPRSVNGEAREKKINESKSQKSKKGLENNGVKDIAGNKVSNTARSVITSLATVNERKRSKRESKRKTNRANRTLRELQVAKTGAILLMVFMVCYGPYTVVHLCHLPFPVPIAAQHFAMWCVFLNSLLTPVIYGLMNKDTRTKIRTVLRKCFR